MSKSAAARLGSARHQSDAFVVSGFRSASVWRWTSGAYAQTVYKELQPYCEASRCAFEFLPSNTLLGTRFTSSKLSAANSSLSSSFAAAYFHLLGVVQVFFRH